MQLNARNPKISVIIPVYNCERFVAETLDSVIAQSCQDWEIVMVDDGSTDRSKDIIQGYQEKFPEKIKYYYQDNAGVAAARNTALKYAQGEYVAFLDADDLWCPQKLQKQINVLDTNSGIGFVYTDNEFVDENGQFIENYTRKVKLISGNILLELYCDFFLMIPSVMVRRSCLNVVGSFDENLKVGEDYDFLLRLAKDFKVEVIKEKLWKRRVCEASTSRRNHVGNAETDIQTLLRFKEKNSDFAYVNRIPIKKRLAEYYFTAGYRALEVGHNGLAFKYFIRSVLLVPTIKVFKNLILCGIPHGLRKKIKGK